MLQGQPNAYMLVYIRTSDWDHLMQPVHIEDIPQPIKQRNQVRKGAAYCCNPCAGINNICCCG